MPYLIQHIDLSGEFCDWQVIFSNEKKYVVFWWKQIPLGDLYTDEIIFFSDNNECRKIIWQKISAAVNHYALEKNKIISFFEKQWMEKDADAFADLFDDYLQTSLQKLPTVTLIICTRNRAAYLQKCLTALKKLNYQPDEIIVVDNAPDDLSTAELVQQFAHVKYVCEKRKGLDYARNCGIKNAESDIVAFTDDDVELHPDWVWRITKNFTDKKVQAVTSLIFAKELDTKAQILFEKYWSFNRGYVPQIFDNDFYSAQINSGVRVWKMGAGAGMAFRKTIFDALGMFDVRLDMGAAGCNGDSEMWYRILAAGWNICYEPLAVAYHTHRREMRGLKEQIFQYMRGFTVAMLIQYRRYHNSGDRYHLFKELPRYYFKTFFSSLIYGFKNRRATIIQEISGYFSGIIYYLQHRKQKPFEISFNNPFPCQNFSEEKPLVSVVITTYNHAKYLPDSINSVLAQTYKNIELIVVDDGSADNAKEVVQQYPAVKYFYQQNKGLSSARNAGAFLCAGELIIFLDADDFLYPQAVEVNLDHFKSNPDAAFVSGWFDMVDEKKKILSTYLMQPAKNNFYPSLLKNNYIGMHAAVMYKRNVFDYFLYDAHLGACEDYDLYMRIARLFKIHSHAQRITGYRMHGTNMSNNILLMVKNVKKVLQKQYATLPVADVYLLYKEGVHVWKTYYTEEILLRLQYKKKYPYYKANLKDCAFCFFTLPFRSIKILALMSMASVKKFVRFILPVSVERWLYSKGWIYDYLPDVGKVKMGDLQRTMPLSREFGYNRGGPVDRYYIENFLTENSSCIKGNVLEIGDNEYTIKFGKEQVTKSDILYIDDSNPAATIIGDLSDLPQVGDNRFDCIILTQTLHLIYDYKIALKNCFRILKKDGVLLMTVPGITNIDYGEWEDTWYWSFTGRSVQRILEEIFLQEKISVKTYGNVMVASAFLHGMGNGEIKQSQKDYHDPHYPVIITAKAIKNQNS